MKCMRVLSLVAAIGLGCLPNLALAVPPANWKDAAYGYTATDTPLKRVLSDFANSFGVDVKLSAEFADKVNGRIQGANAVEFLDRLANLYHFQWFVYNNTLYASPTKDATVERIEVNPEAAEQIKPGLTGLGLLDPKFGWGEFGENGIVTVAGPPEYVRLIRELIQRKEALKPDEFEAMVFRLKYAAVDDRKILVRDQSVVTPGVASMLQNMITRSPGKAGRRAVGGLAGAPAVPGSPAGGGGVPQPSLSTALQSYASLSAPSVLTPGGGDATAAQAASAADVPAAAPAGAGISVIGDVRTNSIIIFDAPRKREYYQRLIDALDVPQQLIEIEAYIVDVNRERLSEFGADLSLGSANRNIGIGTGVATLAAGALSNTTLLVQNLGHFFARLQMLESKGDARTLAKPRVLTLENLTAVLDMSQTVFLKATGERVANITQVTAGTLLRVTPRIIDEAGVPRVHLTVDIEDGSINAIPNSDTPGVQKSSISTQTMLDNQESLVIGGYDVDASGNRVSGIPGLSRIPMVGGLFGTSDTNSQSRQRLFIITPRLVKNGAQREREESALAAEPVVTLAPGATRLRLADRLGTIPVQDTTK